MADDVVLQRLVVSLEGRLTQYERSLRRAQSQTTSTFTAMKKQGQAFEASLARVGTSFIAMFGGAAAIRGAVRLMDASTRITNSLKVAGLEGEALKAVYDRLFQSAQSNAAPLEALVELYGRASLVQKELGVSTEELLGFTDKVAVALRVSGKSAAESSGALLQLSQALGSGVVRAEEFNSILEGALPIAQAAAAGLEEAGGSVAKLRQLVVDGKVSSEAFFRAFEAGSVVLTEKVAGAELTVSQGFIRLQNVLIDTAGKINAATGVTGGMAVALNELAGYVESVGTYFEENEPRIAGFFDAIGGGFAAIEKFKTELREALGLTVIDDFLEGTSLIEGKFGFASDQIVRDAGEIEAALLAALAALVGISDASALSNRITAEFKTLIAQMERGEATAQEVQAALVRLGATEVNFAAIHGLAGLIDELRTARAEAGALALTLAVPQGPQGRGGRRGQTAAAASVETVSLNDYSLPSSGGTRNRAAAAAERERKAVVDLIADLQFEQSLIGKTDAQKRALELTRRAGAAATDEEKAQILSLVDAIETETTAIDAARDAMEQAKGLAKEFASGLVHDLMAGTDATLALSNAFSRLGDRLLEMALDQAINALFANLMGAGLGAIGGGAGLGTGAIGQGVYGGTGGIFPGFATGGWTGSGAGVAGFVHPEEFVIKQGPAAHYRPMLEAMNSDKFTGGGGTDVNVQIIRYPGKPGEQDRVETSQRADGGMDIKAFIVDTVTQAAGNRGSQLNRLLRTGFGSSNPLTER